MTRRNHETYYISNSLAGQKVALVVDAKTASFDVMLGASTLKQLSIKNVVRDELPGAAIYRADA